VDHGTRRRYPWTSKTQGERFTFVSNGVVEAENARRDLFGFNSTRDIGTQQAQAIAEAAAATPSLVPGGGPPTCSRWRRRMS
jgi:hypothetical protein